MVGKRDWICRPRAWLPARHPPRVPLMGGPRPYAAAFGFGDSDKVPESQSNKPDRTKPRPLPSARPNPATAVDPSSRPPPIHLDLDLSLSLPLSRSLPLLPSTAGGHENPLVPCRGYRRRRGQASQGDSDVREARTALPASGEGLAGLPCREVPSIALPATPSPKRPPRARRSIHDG